MNQRVPSPRAALLAVLFGGLLAGCAATGQTGARLTDASPGASPPSRGAPTSPTADDEVLPEVRLSPQLLFTLLASEIAAQRGQLSSAAASYETMARETRDPRLARRATELALGTRNLQLALPAAELWRELAPASTQAARMLEVLYLSTGKLEAAEPLLTQRLAKARDEGSTVDFYRQLRGVLARTSDRPGALRLVDRLAAPDQSVASARLAQSAAAAAAGQSERAVREARAAFDLAPDDEETALSAAELSRTSDSLSGAIDILGAFVERRPKALEARFAYARVLAGAGRREDARAQFEAALTQEPDSPAILFSLAQIAYQTDQKDVARQYLERFVGLPEEVQRDNSPAYLFLGQLLEEKKLDREAIQAYERVAPGEQYLDARIRQAILLGRVGDADRGKSLLRSTQAGTPAERARLTSAEAEILRASGEPLRAFELLDKALSTQPDNADLLYDHAMAAERLDRLEVMEKSLRRVIQLRPDSAHAYNALGYTFADRNLRLPEARTLIEKALELAPRDAHILDSMGWVLYRQGDLQGAEKYLRQAFELMPDAEIAAHLGEVLHKLGRTDEARELWSRARDLDPANTTLKQTLARLNIEL